MADMLTRLLWVCLGGAAGCGARFLAIEGTVKMLGHGFPYGTLLVNVLGSFLAGVLTEAVLHTDWMSGALRLAIITGFLGGFTTYSTFNTETLRLLEKGAYGLGGINMAATVLVCLGAGMVGFIAARTVFAGG